MEQLSFVPLLLEPEWKVPNLLAQPGSLIELARALRSHAQRRAYPEVALKAWEREQKAAAARARRETKIANAPLFEDVRREAERRQQKKRDAKRYKRDGKRIRAAALDSYRRHYISRMVSAAKMRAKKRGLPFNLTTADVVIPEFCPVLGMQLRIGTSGRSAPSPASPSLDRIIPSLGYVVGNVRVISWRANSLKCDASLEEVEKIAAYIRGANG